MSKKNKRILFLDEFNQKKKKKKIFLLLLIYINQRVLDDKKGSIDYRYEKICHLNKMKRNFYLNILVDH